MSRNLWEDQAVFDKSASVSSTYAWYPLTLYLFVEEIALGVMLAKKIECVEKVVYYISKKPFTLRLELLLDREALFSNVWATKNLRHYFQSHQVDVILEWTHCNIY